MAVELYRDREVCVTAEALHAHGCAWRVEALTDAELCTVAPNYERAWGLCALGLLLLAGASQEWAMPGGRPGVLLGLGVAAFAGAGVLLGRERPRYVVRVEVAALGRVEVLTTADGTRAGRVLEALTRARVEFVTT